MAYPKIEKCKDCGANIRRIWMRDRGYPVAVEPDPVEVVPVIGVDPGRGAEWFVMVDETWKGKWEKARRKEENLFYDGVDSVMMFIPHRSHCIRTERKK